MLIVVRHGRTEANRAGLLLGRLDIGLDDVGRAQAAATADAVVVRHGAVDRVVSSPLSRTRATAEAFGRDVETDDRWIELDYGEWDGTPVADVGADRWRAWRSDPDFAPPGGESLATLGRRVRSALDELSTAAADSNIVVVSHVSPIKAALAWALQASVGVHWRAFVAQASITEIAVTDHGPSLRRFNDIGHLPATAVTPEGT